MPWRHAVHVAACRLLLCGNSAAAKMYTYCSLRGSARPRVQGFGHAPGRARFSSTGLPRSCNIHSAHVYGRVSRRTQAW